MVQGGQGAMVQNEQVKSIDKEQVAMIHERFAERVLVLAKQDVFLG